jgi:hypothetical protein
MCLFPSRCAYKQQFSLHWVVRAWLLSLVILPSPLIPAAQNDLSPVALPLRLSRRRSDPFEKQKRSAYV